MSLSQPKRQVRMCLSLQHRTVSGEQVSKLSNIPVCEEVAYIYIDWEKSD